MNGIQYGKLHVDMISDAGGRVERRQAKEPYLRLRHFETHPPSRSLIGRHSQIDTAFRAIQGLRPIGFFATCGYGKSTLLRQIAAESYSRLGVPGVYLVVNQDQPADIVQRVIDALFLTDQPIKFTPEFSTQLLANTRPVVVLDDVTLSPDVLAQLLRSLSSCGVVVGTDQPTIGVSEVLPGLPSEAALALVSQDLGRQPTPAELPAIRQLAATVNGQPLLLRQAAALVRAGERTFATLAQQDRSTLNRLSIDRLAQRERRVLAGVGLLGGALLPTDLVSLISDIGQVGEALADLRHRGLVEQRHNRFGLPVCRAEGYRELVIRNFDLAAAIREIVVWLGTRDPRSEDSLSVVNAVVSLIGFAAERREWQGVVRLVRVAEPILTLAGRWEACLHILDVGIQAATATSDAIAEAFFQHQHGTIDLCLDRLDSAWWHLSRALELRSGLNESAAAVTLNNLGVIAPEPSKPQNRRSAVITAAALVVITIGVIAVAISSSDPIPQRDPYTPGTSPSVQATSTVTDPTVSSTELTTSSPDRTTSPAELHPPALQPVRQDFMDVNVTPGKNIAARTFIVTNPNGKSITLGKSRIDNGSTFSVTSDKCSPSLKPRGTCEVTVTFKPDQIGSYMGALVVPVVGFEDISANLTGKGVAKLTVNVKGDQFGTVTDRTVISCLGDCEEIVSDRKQSTFILVATPKHCTCIFVGWTHGLRKLTGTEFRIEVTKDETVTAEFAESNNSATPTPTIR
jgi:hypothetical protein